MQARDLYGVLLRAGGTVVAVFAVFDLLHAVATWSGYPIIATSYTALQDVEAAIIWVLLATVLLKGADRIVRAVYGPDVQNSN